MMTEGHATVRLAHWCLRVAALFALPIAATVRGQVTAEYSASGASHAPRAADPSPADPSAAKGGTDTPTIIVGFLGGYVSHTDRVHGPVQFAERLRTLYPSIRVEVMENHKLLSAENIIVSFTQEAREGRLSNGRPIEPRVILYGHSWGASATVALARKLEKDGIRVLLTVQVDSIARLGYDDSVIPTNVAHAVNFYQRSGLLRGEPSIRAADPSRTEILGNFRYDYDKKPVVCNGYPWWNRVFSKTHMEIECDPQVWSRVESYVRSELEPLPMRAGGGN
jgi:hypothetical protein